MIGARVEDLTWSDVAQKASHDALAILPIGAIAKEHGYHLPLKTDALQVDWLCDKLMQQRNVLIWPTLGFGFYPAFVEYPGSIHLQSDTFVAVLEDIADSIKRSGHENVCFLNSGISTIEPLNEFVTGCTKFKNLNLINIYSGERYKTASKKIIQQSCGGHADERETSLMLHIARDTVQMNKAVSWASESMQAGAFRRTENTHSNYTPSGIFGDAALATPEKGAVLAEAMLADVIEALGMR